MPEARLRSAGGTEYEDRGREGGEETEREEEGGKKRKREIREREAPKIDAFPMQNSRSTALVVAGQHATENPLRSLSTGLLHPRPSFSPLGRLAFYHHQRLRHLRPEQNRERYRSN